ncbi:preprotein translocase subunit SecE [Sporanaerobium hydrogeniformans]|uniref:Preprotein translocase subunit SecE n=1 Tax=Sporanaerobium hydrogeniformans TaxID=3072179 RepID=A0AC61DE84_9FIRM|nr:preprotein translocase subunit SecE [Sporanaerobium hydrogeniformans]PHV71358.1 preprotein translocase subunit SecE [Sporanaerobium hydrogeniformans]
MVEFFRDFIAESKRVVWPNRPELFKMTFNVVGLSVMVALIIFVMDYAFSTVISLLQGLL